MAQGQAVGSLKVVLLGKPDPWPKCLWFALDGVEQAAFWAARGTPSACGSSDPAVASKR